MSLRLLEGTRPHDAREELRRVELDATNVLGRGHTGDVIVHAYSEWALNAVRMLRSRFAAGDVDDLILTRRYWHLQSAGHVDTQLAPLLVSTEIGERVAALQAEQMRLADEEQRWRRGRILVLDTSALVQGPKLWEWDPAEELELRDMPVHLVLPILVMDELDDLKESTKQHTRYRARETLKWMAAQLGAWQSVRIREGGVSDIDGMTRVRGDVHLEVLLDEPGHTRLPIEDDEIVDRASAIASLSGREVTLVTDDVGQAYRARLAGLTVSMVLKPVYDVDVQEAARAAKQAAKEAQRAATRTP